MLYGILAAVTSLLIAALLAALFRGLGLRAGVFERRPQGSARRRPVPLLGGAAVLAATCLVAGAGEWTGVAPLGDGVGGLLVAGAAVGALGLVADVWRLRARVLVAGTAVAATCVVPYDRTGVPAGILAVGWIVFVTLAFRALDHADGVAGTVGVITAFGIGACAAGEVMDGLAVLLSVLAAALTGFLMHNWYPARVGLGACGSLFTGFLLAASGVFTRAGYGLGEGAGVLFSLTALATADLVLVAVSRRAGGRSLLRSGADHLGHRLRRLGLTPQGTVVLAGLGAFGAVLVGVLAHTGWAGDGAVLWVVGGALVVVLLLLRVPVHPVHPVHGHRRVPVHGPRRGASTQVTEHATGRLRVRSG
ncbi:MraY family glycosyltransferase [Streptomyces sp. NPDC086787]|uniref:MraY family glycosyltransferase n=1 Tax=Streptomyces sp. NPDC086787 TaxID=3365759 RepID=UPI003828D3FD